MNVRWVPWAVLAGLAVGAVPSAGAETLECRRVLRLPATLTRPAVYCLDRNLDTAATSGAAITIAADGVTLDLNGWTLDGSGGGPGTTAAGIRAIGRSRLTVRNGTVRGFSAGIQIVGTGTSSGHVVEGIRADRNTAEGIVVSGRGSRVTGNQVLDTGGSTAPLTPRGHGIVVNAPGGLVAGNLVVGTTSPAGSFSYGIHATRSDGLVIQDNQVLNETPSASYSYGIIVPFSQDVIVSGNRITRTSEGVAYSSGATGVYRDNLTAGVGVPYSGGTDAGNNH